MENTTIALIAAIAAVVSALFAGVSAYLAYRFKREDGTFRARNRKWSSRIETVFINAGKIFDDNTLNDLKFLVASRAADNPAIAMRPEGLVMLQGLISTLEGKL